MIYPHDFESKIGFSTLRSMLIALCEGERGKILASEMKFSDDFNEVSGRLCRVEEMRQLLASGSDMPHPIFFNLESRLAQLRTEGSYLDADTLLKLFKTMNSMQEVREFYCRIGEDSGAPLFPSLFSVFEPLSCFPELCGVISGCVDKFGRVKDNASDGLLKARRALAAANNAVASAMRRALEKAASLGVIEKDTAPSIRDGRMVIPVAAGAKRSISGIIHDESATGKTVFIEPVEVVEAANRLRQLEIEEQREVVLVLQDIAGHIRPFIPALLDSLEILAILDFITAKAKLAIETDAHLPVLENYPSFDWFGAVHPVLLLTLRKQGRGVVPLDLNLDREHRFLIVSGPNAGGKSVVLKTVGIVQYMAQCGLLPTLYDNSHLGVFESIFVDIGDEQSIENDLSTYSSHLRNMKYFLSHAGSRTLLLADEMGSGTEPQIGGALAQAILQRLATTGCFGIVTTHYQNLKTFAESQEGFVNGAMVYDRAHLQPTFRLSIGHPGSSFAIDIARKTGLPADVIENAKELVGSDYVNLDKYLLDIERDRRYWNNKRQNIREKENHLNELLARYEDTSADLRQQRSRILAEARAQASEILSTANAKIESTIRLIRDAQAEKERTRAVRKELADYRESLNKDSAANEPDPLKPLKHKAKRPKPEQKVASSVSVPKEIAVGDYVRMADGGTSGKVLSIQGKKAEVAFGALRTFVELKRLHHAAPPKASSTKSVLTAQTFEDSRIRQLNFKQDIDLRGMRADEALQAVAYFLDDAVQFNAERVRILHGTGNGILKTVIRQQLRDIPTVASFHDEDVRFGGAGITVVDLK